MPILQIRKLGLQEVQPPAQQISGEAADVIPVLMTVMVDGGFELLGLVLLDAMGLWRPEVSLLTPGWFDPLCCSQ